MRVSWGRLVYRAMSFIGLVGLLCTPSLAQPDYGSTSQGSNLSGGNAGGTSNLPGATPGGAAMADFDTLMNLIQQTIDPDSWLAAGGTSSILPYPSGVYVDPAGHMKRVREVEQLSSDWLSASVGPRHPWRKESALRIVSLKQLDQALNTAIHQGLRPSSELLKLAGLSKISYVKLDVAHEDILLAGPAGDQALGFELQDVAVVAALIKSATDPMGCSIEPTHAGLLAAQEVVQQEGAVRKLARNPRMIVEQMQEKIGDHQVHVFGMSAHTGTAVALVDADEHMKKVGFGTVATRQRINSYFDYLDQQDQVPSQSLIRWWFAYADDPIRVNATRDLFQLPEQCVAVLSEQQWVSQQGRAPTGAHDVAADRFAAGMTKHLAGLRRTHPSYSRLCAVFELGLALQLAVEATGQPSLQAWLPNLCALGALESDQNPPPKTVEGLTTWHKLKNGTVVAVVSGGVKLDARMRASSDQWRESKFLASSSVPEKTGPPNSAHGSWWWDGQ